MSFSCRFRVDNGKSSFVSQLQFSRQLQMTGAMKNMKNEEESFFNGKCFIFSRRNSLFLVFQVLSQKECKWMFLKKSVFYFKFLGCSSWWRSKHWSSSWRKLLRNQVSDVGWSSPNKFSGSVVVIGTVYSNL